MRDMAWNAVRHGQPITAPDPDAIKVSYYRRLLWAVVEAVGGEVVVETDVWRKVMAQGPLPEIAVESYPCLEDPTRLAGVIYRSVKKSA